MRTKFQEGQPFTQADGTRFTSQRKRASFPSAHSFAPQDAARQQTPDMPELAIDGRSNRPVTERDGIAATEYLKDGNEARAMSVFGQQHTRRLRGKNLLAIIAGARAQYEATGVYNLTMAMEECYDAMDFAKETYNATAFCKAVELRIKISGHLVEKYDIRMPGFSVQINGVKTLVADSANISDVVQWVEPKPVELEPYDGFAKPVEPKPVELEESDILC